MANFLEIFGRVAGEKVSGIEQKLETVGEKAEQYAHAQLTLQTVSTLAVMVIAVVQLKSYIDKRG